MKLLSAILAFLLLFIAVPTVYATNGTDATPITTVDELLAIEDNPQGNYVLMNDLDLAGIEWPCLNFSGNFDGNGHALLNLELSQPATENATSYDGNLKTYETHFAGFFGLLRNAGVKDLHLLNVRALVEADTPIFLGGLAGYSLDSTITGCTVTGYMELRAHDRMFGIGGLVGYGNGNVQQCKIDVTLICTDTDSKTKDEQFMGGVFATGYMDVSECEINIDGYSSEYGYAHNGGITGMYMRKPLGANYEGNLVDNKITGKITFFERNNNRRAYCAAEAGEKLGGYKKISNTCNFIRDERKTYDVELRPETCTEPIYVETVVPSGCDTYGYREYKCSLCGYAYRDEYTLFTHEVSKWTVVEKSTTEKEGLSKANCDLCGLEFTRVEPILERVPEEPTVTPKKPVSTTVPAENKKEAPLGGILALSASALIVIVCIVFLMKNNVGRTRKC